MTEVLVVGEALIDEVVEPSGVRRHVGGSPANVALGLARLGIPTRLHSAIGEDDDGTLIRQHLCDAGVDITPESSIAAPTSRAVATLAPDGSATYEFALSWEPRALDDLRTPTVIHTGSLAAFLEPGWHVSGDIVRRGRAGGALVTFDPNVRTGLIGDRREAFGRFSTFANSSHVVKLSDEDAAFLFPGRDLGEVLDILVDGGVAVAALTRGSDGVEIASGDVRVSVAAAETVVVDTVGAGDSFMAALIWALVYGPAGWDGRAVSRERLDDIGATAAQAAAITVSRAGADLPSLAELTTAARSRVGG